MRPRSLVFAAAVMALPPWTLCAAGCSGTNVDDLFSAAPAQLPGAGSGAGGGLSGGAAGTAGGAGGAAGTAGGAGGGPTCDPACTQRPGCPDPSCWTATADPNGQSAGLAIDGSEGTRYTTGVLGSGDEWLQVDLCKAMTVVGVNVYTASGTDVAASYTVQVSTDGSTWQTVLTSTTPAKQRMALTFDPVTAQYVRMNQTGKMGFWWSIHEFSVVCQ